MPRFHSHGPEGVWWLWVSEGGSGPEPRPRRLGRPGLAAGYSKLGARLLRPVSLWMASRRPVCDREHDQVRLFLPVPETVPALGTGPWPFGGSWQEIHLCVHWFWKLPLLPKSQTGTEMVEMETGFLPGRAPGSTGGRAAETAGWLGVTLRVPETRATTWLHMGAGVC